MFEEDLCSRAAAALSNAFAVGVIRRPSCSVLMSGMGDEEFNIVSTVYSALLCSYLPLKVVFHF